MQKTLKWWHKILVVKCHHFCHHFMVVFCTFLKVFAETKNPEKCGFSGFCIILPTCLSGERGIRTPGAVTPNGFQDRRDRPLCHLSGAKIHKVFKLCRSALNNYSRQCFCRNTPVGMPLNASHESLRSELTMVVWVWYI